MRRLLSILILPLSLHAQPDPAALNAIFAKAYPADQPGASVLIVHKGQTLLHAGYGLADLAAITPMRPESPHKIGSITKPFTAIAVLNLVNEGKIDLTKSVEEYFPGLLPYGSQIRIEQLLTHVSGIPSYTNQPDFVANMGKPQWDAMSVVKLTTGLPAEFAPGERFAYNNTAYVLLGALIEKTSGMSYSSYIETVIAPKAGLQSTRYGVGAIPGYSPSASGFQPSAHINMDFPHAAGALVSTVSDLYRWTLAVDAGTVVPKPLVDAAWTSATLNDGSKTGYGYGWSLADWNGKRIVEHGGGIPGFVTHAMWLPDEQLFIAVLGNRDGGNPNPQALAREAMAAVFGSSFGPVEISIDPAIFDAYVGEYELAPNFILKVWRDGNAFWTQATGQSAFNIYAESETRFFLKVTPAAIQFAKNEQGEVTHLTLFQAGRELPARKIK